MYALLGGRRRSGSRATPRVWTWSGKPELGFRGFKLPNPYGPEDGTEGIRRTEEMVAAARDTLGPDAELMLDCWMALDVEYTVRLGEALRPYRLRWIEDYLLPDDMAGFADVRRRLPGQSLATGEHWYLARPFAEAAERRLVDYFQPDLQWAGGISACVRICTSRRAPAIAVAPQAGMNDPVPATHRPWCCAMAHGGPVTWGTLARRVHRPACRWRRPRRCRPRRSSGRLAWSRARSGLRSTSTALACDGPRCRRGPT